MKLLYCTLIFSLLLFAFSNNSSWILFFVEAAGKELAPKSQRKGRVSRWSKKTASSNRDLWYHETPQLHPSFYKTKCIGSTLRLGEILHEGQSICSPDIDKFYLGVFPKEVYQWAYPDNPAYTHILIVWDPEYEGIMEFWGLTGPQWQLNETGWYGGRWFENCSAHRGRKGSRIHIYGGNVYPPFFYWASRGVLSIMDTEGDAILWYWLYLTMSGYELTSDYGCYPSGLTEENRCFDILRPGQALGMTDGDGKQYLCEYDSDGYPINKFGIAENNWQLGLMKNDRLVWQPDSPLLHADDYGSYPYRKCDFYLRFQQDGHLTFYEGNYSHPNEYFWGSHCIDSTATKLMIRDGDVNMFNEAGAVVWTLPGSRIDPQEEILKHDGSDDWTVDSTLPICQCQK